MRALHTLKHLFGIAALCGLAFASAGAQADPAKPADGVEYLTLATPQPTDTGKKIEVIEFFAYWCPHCNVFEPLLEAWVKKQGNNIVFKRVHVPYNEGTLPQQKLYFTLESLGLADQYQTQVFHAVHAERNRLNRDEQAIEWAAKAGIDSKKFVDTYRSFGVQAKVRRASAMMDSYKIESWPTVVIDGRFQTSPHQAGAGSRAPLSEAEQHTGALQVMDFLVAKAKAEKK